MIAATRLPRGTLTFEPESHTYAVGGKEVTYISEVLKGAGLVDGSWFTQYSRDFGTAGHIACQLYDEGDLNEENLDPSLVPVLEAWKRFRAESGFVPTVIERPFYHRAYGFAGTPDRFGKLNGYDVVVEIKTGAIYRVTGVQLAAQAMLLEDNGLKPVKRFAVHGLKTGKYSLKEFKDPGDFNVFVSALVTSQWIKGGIS